MVLVVSNVIMQGNSSGDKKNGGFGFTIESVLSNAVVLYIFFNYGLTYLIAEQEYIEG